MKNCTKCGEQKPLSEFYKDKNRKLGVRVYCKNCSKLKPEERKRYNKTYQLKSLYSLTNADYEQLKKEQNNSCAICKERLDDGFGTHVDHNHKTGLVRAVLCRKCNLLLGHAKDSTDILQSAIMYLNKYNGELK
jgi:hypothetical protein